MGTRTAPPAASAEERTVRLARRRFSRRQWARRWLAWRRLVVLLLVAAVAAGLVWLFYFSSMLSVSGATVTGAAGRDAAVVRLAAQVPVGTPLATADLSAIAARVERLPVVASADVSRAWPDHVRIDVTERTPVAAVVRGGSFSAVDADGVRFRSYRARPAGLPVVHMASSTDTHALGEAARVAAALPRAIATKVDYVDVRTVDTITLHLHGGKEILWGSAEQSGDKAAVLVPLLKHRARYYDVSVPLQPVLRR